MMKNKKSIGICMIILLLLSIFPVTANSTEKINEYSTKVASLIEEKCNSSCENVLILGEDAVVPHYRRKIGMYSGMWWWKELDKEDLLTDQLYTQTGSIYFADIDKLFGKKQDVIFIISSDLTDDLHGKVEELKTTIENKYPSSDVTTVEESTVACNSFSKLDDATLIIIGDEGNNNAINCMPFLPKETSYISIERNVWDNEHYAIVLNPTEDIYDNLLALINIVKDGPDPDWHFGNTVVACLWDGKFGGSVPTAKEITCNMLPLIELAPDIRDSWHCKKYLTPWFIFDEEKDNAVDVIICEVVHFATAYDLATWGAAIFTAGISGAGGEIIDGSIATLKISLKTMLPAIAEAVGKKMVKEALETIMSAPKLLKGVTELIIKSPKLIPQMIEASLHILRHGPEVAEACFDFIKQFTDVKWTKEYLANLAHFKKLQIKDKLKIGIPVKDLELTDDGITVIMRKPKPEDILEMFDEKFADDLKEIQDSFDVSEEYLKEVSFIDEIEGLGVEGLYDDKVTQKVFIPRKVQGVKNDVVKIKQAVIPHEISHAKIRELLNGEDIFSFVKNVDKEKETIINSFEEELLTNKVALHWLKGARKQEFIAKITSEARFIPNHAAVKQLADEKLYDELIYLAVNADTFGLTALKTEVNKVIATLPKNVKKEVEELIPLCDTYSNLDTVPLSKFKTEFDKIIQRIYKLNTQ